MGLLSPSYLFLSSLQSEILLRSKAARCSCLEILSGSASHTEIKSSSFIDTPSGFLLESPLLSCPSSSPVFGDVLSGIAYISWILSWWVMFPSNPELLLHSSSAFPPPLPLFPVPPASSKSQLDVSSLTSLPACQVRWDKLSRILDLCYYTMIIFQLNLRSVLKKDLVSFSVCSNV